MFWFLWYFIESDNEDRSNFPWPVFPMLGWGIGLAFSYLGAYVFTKQNAIEKEFEKLKSKDN